MRWCSRKSGLVFRRRICSTVPDPDRAVWRRGTGSDEISGGHDDEQGADYRGISEKDGCFYVQHLFFTLYAMLNSMVFYSGNLAEKVIRDCGGYLEGKKECCRISSASSGVWRDCAVLQKSAVFGLRDILLWKIGTPFVVGVPVLLCLTGERKKHNKKCVCLCWYVFCLGVFSYRGAMSQNLRIRHSRSFEYQRSGRFPKCVAES